MPVFAKDMRKLVDDMMGEKTSSIMETIDKEIQEAAKEGYSSVYVNVTPEQLALIKSHYEYYGFRVEIDVTLDGWKRIRKLIISW